MNENFLEAFEHADTPRIQVDTLTSVLEKVGYALYNNRDFLTQ
jgi:hypothetical protein